MDAIIHGIASFMEWIFKLIKPMGISIDLLFIFLISAGIVFWLWYDMYERKTGKNFMADKGKKS